MEDILAADYHYGRFDRQLRECPEMFGLLRVPARSNKQHHEQSQDRTNLGFDLLGLYHDLTVDLDRNPD